jgi:hypothetical protein
MYRIATAAAVIVALTGCSGLSRSQVGTRDGNAVITGVVSLPASGMQKGEDPCEGVRVQVAAPGASEADAMGSVQLKQSRGRCMYVASSIPSNADVQVTVTPGSAWKCDNGAAPALTPANASLKLRDYETATRDFAVACSESAAQATGSP